MSFLFLSIAYLNSCVTIVLLPLRKEGQRRVVFKAGLEHLIHLININDRYPSETCGNFDVI